MQTVHRGSQSTQFRLWPACCQGWLRCGCAQPSGTGRHGKDQWM